MSFTRVWQAGAELQHANELNEYGSYGDSSMVVSNTKANTGSYSFRTTDYMYPRGYSGTFSELRSGCFINHNGHYQPGAYYAYLWVIPTSLAAPIVVSWQQNTAMLNMYVNGVLVDAVSVTTQGFSTTNAWHSLGITYKADAATGFCSMYINGVRVLTFTGNTGTQANGVFFGGSSEKFVGWGNYAYFDDFYVDSASGEADTIPPTPVFPWKAVSGAGTSAVWTANGASPNYECVNDAVPNDATDYVSAGSDALVDYYGVDNFTVPGGKSIAAYIPTVWGNRSDNSINSQIKLGARLSGTDASDVAKTPTTSFGGVFGRLTTKPGGGAWTESDANSAELKLESDGAFA